MGRAGFEHSALKASKTPISENPRTESGTVKDDRGQNDLDLARLIESWPHLPEHTKRDILNLTKDRGDDHE